MSEEQYANNNSKSNKKDKKNKNNNNKNNAQDEEQEKKVPECPENVVSGGHDIMRFVKNTGLLLISYVSRVMRPQLTSPNARDILTAADEDLIVRTSTHAKKEYEQNGSSACTGGAVAKYVGTRGSFHGAEIDSKYYYYLSDLDEYRDMVKNRLVRKYTPPIYPMLVGLNKTDKTLFVEANEFRDAWKTKYLLSLHRDRIQIYMRRWHEHLMQEVPLFGKQNDLFKQDGMNDTLHRLAAKFLCLSHFGYVPADKYVEYMRIQSKPFNFGISTKDVTTLLLVSGPKVRKLYEKELDRHKKRAKDGNIPQNELDIFDGWIEAGMPDEIIFGEMTHNSLTTAPINHQFTNIMYYLWKYPQWKHRLRREMAAIPDQDFSNLDEIDQLPDLDKFIQEISRLACPDFGLSCVEKDTVGGVPVKTSIPKKCPFSFKHFTSGFKAEYWGPTYAEFFPDRFQGHIKDHQAPRVEFKDGIERTNRDGGEYVPPGLFINSNDGFAAFGVGERRCNGEPMVNYLTKIFTLHMIKRYDWHAINPELIDTRVFIGVLSPGVGDDSRFMLSDIQCDGTTCRCGEPCG